MLARIHKAMKEKDEGFTLIELLVVMIIIGILAAIAIPVFLSQRAKARDTATKSDVTTVGKEVATYYVDNTAQLYASVSGNVLTIRTGSYSGTAVTTVTLSNGTAEITSGSTAITFPASCTNYAGNWIVGLKNPSGSQQTYYYSATAGLSTSAPTACV
ncbi:type II secretion system protein [Spongisporangium articulatum]|uniref:Type II secretion system protein n=1 Tax=Spongisporangium articulatum TaxID=3362603 RepID=A0ABW8AR67_9ACTN